MRLLESFLLAPTRISAAGADSPFLELCYVRLSFDEAESAKLLVHAAGLKRSSARPCNPDGPRRFLEIWLRNTSRCQTLSVSVMCGNMTYCHNGHWFPMLNGSEAWRGEASEVESLWLACLPRH